MPEWAKELRDDLQRGLTTVRSDISAVRADLTTIMVGTRADIMARIDRLQNDLTQHKDEGEVTFGAAAGATREIRNLRRHVDALDEQMAAMMRMVQRLNRRDEGEGAN